MTSLETITDLADDWFFSRNLVGGEWLFPQLPYEFDVHSPSTSAVLATIPLSSRRDVAVARRSATDARCPWSDRQHRNEVLTCFVDLLDSQVEQLAHVQSLETGLHPEDSRLLTKGAVTGLRRRLTSMSSAVEERPGTESSIVTGHVLASGAPVVEMLACVATSLCDGHTAVVNPSLRAPLSSIAVARLFEFAGPPPGTLNVVQGLGVDVGAALVSDRAIGQLWLRGRPSWVRRAAGQRRRLGRPDPWVATRFSNVLYVGPGFDALGVADAIRHGLRANTAGGPLGLRAVAAHPEVYDEVVALAVEVADGLTCAPLSSRRHRELTCDLLEGMTRRGAMALTMSVLPDDRQHRMGWYLPPTLMEVHADLVDAAPAVSGPVLFLARWSAGGDGAPRCHADPGTTFFATGDLDRRKPEERVIRASLHHEAVALGELPAPWEIRKPQPLAPEAVTP